MVTWFSLIGLRPWRKFLRVLHLYCIRVWYKTCLRLNHNMSIYRKLNPRLLVQVGDLSSHIVGVDLNLLMKPKMIVSRRPHQGLDEVMFPTKMREKGTKVALVNGSPITKLVEFSLSLRESECNSVCLNMHTFLLVLVGLFITLVVRRLIISVTDGSLLMAFLVVLSNVCLSLNKGLIGSWLTFLKVEAHRLQNH